MRRWLYRIDLKRRGAVLPRHINGFNYLFGNVKGLRSGGHNLIEPGARLNIGGEEARLDLGSYVYINSYTIIDCHYRVSIGDRVQIGPHCYIGDFDHDIQVNIHGRHHRNSKKYVAVVIEDNVWIGAGAIILKGVTIGKNSVIAAGSVVTGNIPTNAVAAGSPAKVVKLVEGNQDQERNNL